MKRMILSCVALCLMASVAFALGVGAKAPKVVIDGKDGGKVSGGPWSSSELNGIVTVLFYVDPDEADTNDHVGDALVKEDYPADKFRSVAVVNMKATWIPNWAIKNKLEQKQKKFPKALYVMDKTKVLVNKWGLPDDASNVLLFDRSGKLLFMRSGKMSKSDLQKMLALIDDCLTPAKPQKAEAPVKAEEAKTDEQKKAPVDEPAVAEEAK